MRYPLHIEIASTEQPYQIGPNHTIVVVNGLGGKSTRDCGDDLASNAWWGSVLCKNRGFHSGSAVSFCHFDPNGVDAHCYLKSAQNGTVLDSFTIVNA